MIGALIVTHGDISKALLDAACSIIGSAENVVAVDVGSEDSSDVIKGKISSALERLDTSSGAFIFTDMFGGTPTNIALTLHDEGRVEVITGVNLPLLLKFLNSRPKLGMKELSDKLVDYGHKSIANASRVLGKKGETV